MKRLDWFIARRYLASRRKGRFVSLITLIAVGGVFVGVAALIVVIAVMTGLQQDLQAKIIGMNPHVYVFQQGRGFRMPEWRPVLETVRLAPGVVVAEPFIMTQVAVYVPGTDYAQAGMLYGMDPSPEGEALTTVQRQIASGELSFGPTSTGYPPLVMGRRLAEKLALYPGDTVQVVSLENVRTGGGGEMMPTIRPFEVTDRFTTGMYEYDSNFMYTGIEPVQEILDLGDGVGAIGVNVTDPWSAQATARWIENELRFPYYTNDWVELNSSLFSALKLEKIVMSVILFLIVVVAAFNIISTLIMVVADKTREIGILKSMGMKDSTVLRIFVLQGLTIGIVGTLMGTALGLGLSWAVDTYQFIELPGDVYFLDSLPVALDPVDVILIVLLSITVALAATIYPARQASRLLPVEAIRHD